MRTKLLITGLALMAMTTVVSAQNQGASQRQSDGTGRGSAFVDANKNGICDNFENRTTNTTTATGKNFCNGRGRGMRSGQGQGSGQRGVRRGSGTRKNFTDANNNGICDFREAAEKI